ncbi:N-terminal domain intergin-like repeats and c-terminal - cell wall-associated hydrolase domain [Acidisarcina polymorpha]|uniref:N-terminal domain intergin-like repeats and c-terminal-cell wall-associated hydrolase domain n=1 Tax=Acidisarcina polymorpha TaxID=2211140 RepID=A0A2Z5G814_9BACT|nr:N-terminal domain intergin-like repeats and c-terminal - cell wall-associated hydrolase domain [Acidisarcina polymorpha]
MLAPGIRGSAAAGTATTLAVTSGGSATTTVAAGSAITLTAKVTSGAMALTTGQVNFCDASVPYCTDIHSLGTAQLTSAGTAIMRLIPGIGSHSYKVVFSGTIAYSTSSSAASSLAVTFAGPYTSATTFTSSGNPGGYTLTASVVGSPRSATVAPTGVISFLNTTSNNQVVTTATLTPSAQPLSYSMPDPGVYILNPSAMVTGDFNEDGKPDLLLSGIDSNFQSSGFAMALGNGDGTFTHSTVANITENETVMAVGDFNQDGHLDVAALGSSGLTILLGNGDGTFNNNAIVVTPSVPEYALWVAGDFSGDGILDLAYTNIPLPGVTVLLGNGDGTFAAPITGTTAPADGALVTGDFNGDGKLDLALSSPANGTITVLLGQGNGTFVAAAPVSLVNADPIVTGDFNGDGKLDLAAASSDQTLTL